MKLSACEHKWQGEEEYDNTYLVLLRLFVSLGVDASPVKLRMGGVVRPVTEDHCPGVEKSVEKGDRDSGLVGHPGTLPFHDGVILAVADKDSAGMEYLTRGQSCAVRQQLWG